ncbi:AfsR/SARP family transcriptional regulator [Streptomyces sp. NRRL WC-3725]|uniref:AfsR/SARP family transcriptional regulator n=1 Tax=Streptomyces sp. NRRL WC-3725 TaxID=1463933 RepID=UPI000690C918|nr:AfsR/SARP family transcriptional regulator [Streptomyces sp. NRRL WC-3725]
MPMPMPMTPPGPALAAGTPQETVRFSLLGPLRAWRDGTELPLGPRQQRLILAALLARAGRPVPLADLVDLLWEGDPPTSAANAVHRYVGVLRRLLEPDLPARNAGRWLVRQDGGYLLRVGAGELDLLRFRALVRQAREKAAEGDAHEAVRRFGEALSQWQGRCAADLGPVAGAHRVFATVEREHASVVCETAAAALRCDSPGPVLLSVRQAAQRHPLDQRLQAHLLLVLGADGKQAEALTLYQDVRGRLWRELGVRPGAELRAAYERVLRQNEQRPAVPGDAPGDSGEEDVLRAVGGGQTPHTPVPAAEPGSVPAQLPADLPCFSGRARQMEQALALAGETSDALRVLALDGIPGVGKTALAVHFAHRLAARFPDGQLFVDLRGFGSGGSPRDPGEVLCEFLEALGVRRWRVPASTESRAALFRSVLADRKVLVVLDNALDLKQIRPLLPGSPLCMVVVTSRRRLSGLAAAHGARLVGLDVPAPAEAAESFLRRLGPARADARAGVVEDIVERCGRLPLALAVAAARALARPDQPLSVLAAELAGTEKNLDGFTDDDRGNGVRAVLFRAYRTLGPEAALTFRLLPHLGPEYSTAALADATGLPPQATVAAAGELVRAGLLTAGGNGRYAAHRLVLAYAAELARADASRHPEDQEGRYRDALSAGADRLTGELSALRVVAGGVVEPVLSAGLARRRRDRWPRVPGTHLPPDGARQDGPAGSRPRAPAAAAHPSPAG